MAHEYKVGDLVTWTHWYSDWHFVDYKAVVTGFTPKGRVRIQYPTGRLAGATSKATVPARQLRPRVTE